MGIQRLCSDEIAYPLRCYPPPPPPAARSNTSHSCLVPGSSWHERHPHCTREPQTSPYSFHHASVVPHMPGSALAAMRFRRQCSTSRPSPEAEFHGPPPRCVLSRTCVIDGRAPLLVPPIRSPTRPHSFHPPHRTQTIHSLTSLRLRTPPPSLPSPPLFLRHNRSPSRLSKAPASRSGGKMVRLLHAS